MDGSVVLAGGRQCAPHLIMLLWVHPSPQPKPHVDRYSRFCRAHYCEKQTDIQTDRQTDRPTGHAARSLTIGRIYVRSTAVCPNGQSNLKKGRIAAAHGRFNRIRQVVPMCTHLTHASLDLGPTRVHIYTVEHKKRRSELMSITLLNLNRFSEFFYC